MNLSLDLTQVELKLRSEYREVVVDFIVVDEDKQAIWVQKRLPTRELFPDLWEFPGGLLQAGEELLRCIRRNLFEETGMELVQVIDLVHVFPWDEDNDVATAQFLIEATGEYVPDRSKVSQHQLMRQSEMQLLLIDNDETPIYRGAFYAFRHLSTTPPSFSQVIFYDNLVMRFFKFFGIQASPLKVIVEECKDFLVNQATSILSIDPSFVDEPNNFANANIALHQLFHNYCQNIISYDDIVNVRSGFGINFSYYLDIVADVHTYRFLHEYYGFSERQYFEICYKKLSHYQAGSLQASKSTRLMGAIASIRFKPSETGTFVIPLFFNKDPICRILMTTNKLGFEQINIPPADHQIFTSAFTGGMIEVDQFHAATIRLLAAITKTGVYDA